jgi:mono/diheme cytochrome c family protein
MAKDGLRALSVVSVALLGWISWSTPALGISEHTATVDAGKTYYHRYCATCHGANGKGDGPLSSQLKKPAPDLTTLSKNNGGKFPYIDVLNVIDGDTPYPAHGSSEMPAWGETFQSDVPGDVMQQAAVRGRLMLLTDYLRSIQQK